MSESQSQDAQEYEAMWVAFSNSITHPIHEHESCVEHQGAHPPHDQTPSLTGPSLVNAFSTESNRRLRQGSEMEMGDTQLMPSQVYRDYLLANAKAIGADPKHGTYATGDTGYVDFADIGVPSSRGSSLSRHDSLQPSEGGGSEHGDAHSETVSPEILRHPAHTQEPSRPSSRFEAVTPLAGRKHDRQGEVIDRDCDHERAEDLEACFGGEADQQAGMGMTQLFHNTQAGSNSPGSPANLRSDPIFDRPSPTILNAPRSTPPQPSSSPTSVRQATAAKTAADLREEYVPVGESQRQRSKPKAGSNPFDDNEEDDWGQDSEERQAERRRKRKLIEQSARHQFQGFTAPTPVKVDKRRKILATQTVIGLVTPRWKTNGKEVITISSDHKTPGANAAHPDDSDTSVDEYDELSQTIVPSRHQLPDQGASVKALSPTGTVNAHRPNSSPVPGKYAASTTAFRRREVNGNTEERESQAWELHENNNQFEHQACVRDSQPDRRSSQVKNARKPLLPSSVTSRGFISQSQLPQSRDNHQYTDKVVSGAGLILETSSIPPPPSTPGSSPPRAPDIERYDTAIRSPDLTHNKTVRPHQCLNSEPATEAAEPHDVTQPAVSANKEEQKSGDMYKPGISRQPLINIPETSPMNRPLPHDDSAVIAERPPSTDVESRRSWQHSTHPIDGTDVEQSGLVDDFQTARSTAGQLPATSTPQTTPRKIASLTPSSIHRPGVRKMVDIAGTATPARASNPLEMQDLSILNGDDQAYHSAMSAPSDQNLDSKRMRFTKRKQLSCKASRDAIVNEPSTKSSSLCNAAYGSKQSSESQEGAGSFVKKNDGTTAASGHTVNTEHSVAAFAGERSGACNARSQSAIVCAPESNERRSRPFAHADHVPNPKRSPGAALTIKLPGDHVNHVPTSENRCRQAMFPNRLLAIFKGHDLAYYPATFLGYADYTTSSLKVRFDDGSESIVGGHLVKRLEFKNGDLVKIDLPGKKKTTYSVQAVRNELRDDETAPSEGHGTDIFGNTNLVVVPKQRASLPTGPRTAIVGEISVSIQDIYLPQTLWSNLKHRTFTAVSNASDSRLQTPSDRTQTPSTPSSRTRRAAPVLPALNNAQKEAISFQQQSGVFSSMAFCLSFSGEQDIDRAHVADEIGANGGCVLEEGFDQLFDLVKPNNGSPPPTAGQLLAPASSLILSESARDLGFVALITDRYSRRIKYIQALALNLPCLHSRWISDSIQFGSPQPVSKYLLPAGESMFLQGAVRSRTLNGLDFASTAALKNAKLNQMVHNRVPLLLNRKVMLIVGNGKVDERRKVYPFLARAAYAEKTHRAKDIPAAKAVLKEDSAWDYIVVEDGRVQEANKKLFGGSNRSVKANFESTTRRQCADASLGQKPRVIGDETILQSFIQGSWAMEDMA
ncbi:MAG: hypothetical protein Q9159_004810 [Coniocarpon cinnabarinum]